MSKYDYLVVGTGFFGSVFAHEKRKQGYKVLAVEKRNHIGGNCYTENKNGINIHKYGPHIFNTNSLKIWDYIQQFTTFNHFSYRPKVNYQGNLYSFPINLMTLYQLWGVKTPKEARLYLDHKVEAISEPANLEEFVLSKVGREIYETFIYGYTKKQWGTEPKNLPSFIIKRIPIRLTFDDNYYNSKYQGIPIGGYTRIFEKLLDGIQVIQDCNYLNNKDSFKNVADKIVYTGAIDEYYGYQYGQLEYRSLSFKEEHHKGDYQGIAAINYTEQKIPYTRIIEHKHFEFIESDTTIITKEYPQDWDISKERYYPINSPRNDELYLKYKNIENDKVLFGGRLGTYRYFNMDQIIAAALKASIDF